MNYIVLDIHPDYKVYEDGRVYSMIKNRFLKGLIKDDGYCMYWLKDLTGKADWVYTHRLVYQAFNEDFNEELEVNHIDGNRSNNHYSNLNLMTHRDNIKYSYDVLNRKRYKGEESWNYGKIATDSTRELMSAKKIGINHPKFKGYYVVNGIKYESSYIAAKILNTYPKKIYKDCMNNRNGCYFEPV